MFFINPNGPDWYVFAISIIFFLGAFVFFTIVCLVPAIKKIKKYLYISKTVVPFFKQLEVEHGAKYPILMESLDSNIPELMPEDSNKTCIFFGGSNLIIKSLFKPDLCIEIPCSDLNIVYTKYFSSDKYYYIIIKWKNTARSCEIKLHPPELKWLNKKAYGTYFFVNGFVQQLKTFNK